MFLLIRHTNINRLNCTTKTNGAVTKIHSRSAYSALYLFYVLRQLFCILHSVLSGSPFDLFIIENIIFNSVYHRDMIYK